MVTSFSDNHKFGKTNSDVECLYFWYGTMHYLPQGVGNIFKNLKTIVIGNNLDFKVLKQSNFNNLNNLVRLEIQRNEIETFDMDALWNLKNLQKISINKNLENTFKSINKEMFEKNVKLTEIQLIDIRMESLDEKTLFFLNDLKTFSIKSNNVEIIRSRTFEGNTELTKVDLSNNRIKILDDKTFSYLKNLETINIRNNLLIHIGDVMFDGNAKLKHIDLSSNLLQTLPHNLFSNNLLLEYVNFANNQLSIILTDFSKLVNANFLNLDYNICISLSYTHDSATESAAINLADFQSMIHLQCSSIQDD